MFNYQDLSQQQPAEPSGAMQNIAATIERDPDLGQTTLDMIAHLLSQDTGLPVRVQRQRGGAIEITVALPSDHERWNEQPPKGVITVIDGVKMWQPLP